MKRYGTTMLLGLVTIAGAILAIAHVSIPNTLRFSQVVAKRVGILNNPFPSGPCDVGSVVLGLPPGPGTAHELDTIPVRVWFPRVNKCNARLLNEAERPLAQLASFAKPIGGSVFPVLLYAPGYKDSKDDNSITALDLASHGYVVVAMDDIDWRPDPAQMNASDDFDMSSPDAFRATLRHLDGKVRQQADRAGMIIDRLEAYNERAETPWPGGLDLRRVGFFGWSYGGATAAEASIRDPRIVSSVNMDGWLFGDAAAGAQTKPSLTLLSDYLPPTLERLQSSNWKTRFEAVMDFRDLIEKIRLGLLEDGYFIRVADSIHENYSDKIIDPKFWKSWFRVDPYETKLKVDRVLVAFFDLYLAGRPSDILADAHPSAADTLYRVSTQTWVDWPSEVETH